MTPLRSRDDVDRVLGLTGTALLYKHSTRCPVSMDAYDEVQAFALSHPDVPVFIVDVVRERPVSQYVAEVTGIVHQSPQVLLLCDGSLGWSGSHYSITVRELEAELAALTCR
jgi:bacillithiol system protein YtxJ